MNVQLNHTIVWCRDQAKSTEFLTRILGLPPARRFMHFLVIGLSNQVSIDYFETTDPIALQHLAFLVSEPDFDVVLGRLRENVPQIWADPGARSLVRSITSVVAAGSTSGIPTATCSRCSRALTATLPDDAAAWLEGLLPVRPPRVEFERRRAYRLPRCDRVRRHAGLGSLAPAAIRRAPWTKV